VKAVTDSERIDLLRSGSVVSSSTDASLQRYAKDPEVMVFELHTEAKRWWK